MDRRETLQDLIKEGRKQLSSSHTKARRLDGLKGLLFMRRDVACRDARRHFEQLKSRLTNICDQTLAEIEQLCHAKEKNLITDKNYILERMSSLTDFCSHATDYLQFGNEDSCQTEECEQVIHKFQQLLQARISSEDVDYGQQYLSFGYVPLLQDKCLDITSVGMLKTSILDPREVEIETGNNSLKQISPGEFLMTVYVNSNVPRISHDDIMLFQAKVTDCNGENGPIKSKVVAEDESKLELTFPPKLDEAYLVTVKLYGIHVVNSPYKIVAKIHSSDETSTSGQEEDSGCGSGSLSADCGSGRDLSNICSPVVTSLSTIDTSGKGDNTTKQSNKFEGKNFISLKLPKELSHTGDATNTVSRKLSCYSDDNSAKLSQGQQQEHRLKPCFALKESIPNEQVNEIPMMRHEARQHELVNGYYNRAVYVPSPLYPRPHFHHGLPGLSPWDQTGQVGWARNIHLQPSQTALARFLQSQKLHSSFLPHSSDQKR